MRILSITYLHKYFCEYSTFLVRHAQKEQILLKQAQSQLSIKSL